MRSPPSADDLEVGEAGEDRLPTDRRVLEHDGDLLFAAGELRRHDDPIAPASVADAVTVAELALARDDRPLWADRRRRWFRSGTRSPERARRRPTGKGLAFRSEVAARPERLARWRCTGSAAPLAERRAAGPQWRVEPGRSARAEGEVEIDIERALPAGQVGPDHQLGRDLEQEPRWHRRLAHPPGRPSPR